MMCIDYEPWSAEMYRRWGSPDRLSWFRIVPECMICGATRDIQVHHVKHWGSGGDFRDNLVPLCMFHHMQCHTMGRDSFAEKYNVDLTQAAIDYARRYEDSRADEWLN